MHNIQTQAGWQKHLDEALPIITNILNRHGYTLSPDQPHIKGERFLMQAMTTNGGRKLILLGSRENTQVVIKATNDPTGKDELRHERVCRQTLHQIDFAYDSFHSPAEVEFFTESDFLFSIQEFIPQTSSFLDRSLTEQFELSLHAFTIQEHARATTRRHFRNTARVFGNRTSADYLRLFEHFRIYLEHEHVAPMVLANIHSGEALLTKHQERIEQYCGFLTHTDFVPHNFRIKSDTLYLLDFSSLRFGNKHESWARFLNFMTLYNPELEALLIQYVDNNRSTEERESLQLMRVFRLGEIISYYTKTLSQSTSDLLELNTARVNFWSDVLAAELQNQRVEREIVAAYKKKRDNLRSTDEKVRQIGLH